MESEGVQTGAQTDAAALGGELGTVGDAVGEVVGDLQGDGSEVAEGKEPAAEQTADGEGVITKPEDYKVEMPEGMQEDPELMPGFRDMAVEMGLSQAEFSKVVGMYNGVIQTRADAQAKAASDQARRWEGDLRNEWKGDYDVNVKALDGFIDKFGGPEMVELAKNTALTKHPVVAKFLLMFSQAVSEDSLVVKGGRLGAGTPQRTTSGNPVINLG